MHHHARRGSGHDQRVTPLAGHPAALGPCRAVPHQHRPHGFGRRSHGEAATTAAAAAAAASASNATAAAGTFSGTEIFTGSAASRGCQRRSCATAADVARGKAPIGTGIIDRNGTRDRHRSTMIGRRSAGSIPSSGGGRLRIVPIKEKKSSTTPCDRRTHKQLRCTLLWSTYTLGTTFSLQDMHARRYSRMTRPLFFLRLLSSFTSHRRGGLRSCRVDGSPQSHEHVLEVAQESRVHEPKGAA